MRITKSRFMVYCDAPIHYWAAVHGHHTVSESDPMMEYLAVQGYRAEPLAVQYLREHILPTYADAELFEQWECHSEPFFARIDVAIYDRQAGVYDLYEIKSGTSYESYVRDVAFQRAVFRRQFPIRHTYLVYLNKSYVRRGHLDVAQLFVHRHMDNDIDDIAADIAQYQHDAQRLLTCEDSAGLEPCTNPKTCPCPAICHPNLPTYSIYNIPRISLKKKIALRRQGIVAIDDIPPEMRFTNNARTHITVMQHGETLMDVAAIATQLAKIEYPITFLDYEAAKQTVPLDGFAPNQDAAFQYAMYVIDYPDAPLRSAAYLSDGTGDFVRTLIEHLVHDMPAHGSVVVWNKTYEKGINQVLANAYPEYAAALHNMNRRMFDLADVFRKNYYVAAKFQGSWSIKAVLPVLVPELTYTDLDVTNGGSAVWEWNRMVDVQTSAYEKAHIRTALLAYCGQDALAMYEIWRVLHEICTAR